MATKSSVQQRRRSRRRAALVLVPTVAGVFVAGSAFAYWSTSGSGTGTSATGTNQAVTVQQIGTVTNLQPGGADQPIPFQITNPQSTNQYIASVQITIDSLANVGNTALGCTASDFAITQPTALNRDMLPGVNTINPSGALIHMINKATNQDDCKSVTLNLQFAAA